MKGTLVLTLLGAILCNVELASAQTGTPYYHCANNSMQGSTGPPVFTLNGDTLTWEPNLDETNQAGAQCSGNVETGNVPTCSETVSLNGTSIISVIDGVFESGESTFTYEPLCAIPKGECNVALAKRITVSTGWECSGTGSWTKISATDTSFTVNYDSSINLTSCVDHNSAQNSYCVNVEIGYSSACGGTDYVEAISFWQQYEDLCSQSEWSVSSGVATFYIDANVVAEDAIKDLGAYDEQYWSTTDRSFTFEASYLAAPTFHNEFNNETISVVEDMTAFTVRQNLQAAARTDLQDSCTLTVTDMSNGEDMNANGLTSGACSTLEVGDCFTLTINSKVYDCGTSPSYDGSAQSMTFDNGNYWYYTYGSGVTCPSTNELCCLSFELNLALDDTRSNACQYANGNSRRLSSPNARYLEDSGAKNNNIATLVHTVHVARAGDAPHGQGPRSAGNSKSDSGVAGWIPAAGVGGLLLLAGAVIAVTRRPSLLRGAFHGPTKVLPNEEK